MPRSQPQTGSSPRLVLIGTEETVRLAARQCAVLGVAAPEILGAVLIQAPADTAPPHDLTILGALRDLPALHQRHRFDAALVSLPLAMTAAIGRVRSALASLGIAERFLPTMADVLSRPPVPGATTPPAPDLLDLVGRRPRDLDTEPVRRAIADRRVLITGAGGSIGSEIARICAAFGPSMLILMERAENALFEIDRQIAARFPHLPRRAVLHDVTDAPATLRRVASLGPEVVFHAAAHKHVPMMEDHPAAAVANNLFGTKSIADAALAVGAERFVMVSTDKAVNPTSVMGATKRLAEVYIRSLAESAGRPNETRFSMVRFGNVLGSACSVLPIWAAQIAEGGPVTVTHPAMTRYFMTIPEAASLVIHAATIDETEVPGAGVFVLDMGEPVSIRKLAERFIRAHGLAPAWEDPHGLMPVNGGTELRTGQWHDLPAIRATFTGIRPGEKLHEELAYSVEELAPTSVPGVLAWSGPTPDRRAVARMLADLSGVRDVDDAASVLGAIRKHVPEMRPRTPEQTPTAVAA